MDIQMHIPDEDLAALAGGNLDPEREAEIRAHMATCRQCYAIYAEAVRAHTQWTQSPESMAPDAELERLAVEIAVPGRVHSRAKMPWVLVPISALVVVVALLWTQTDLFHSQLPLDASSRAVLQGAMASASTTEMILPGGNTFTSADLARRRSDPPMEKPNLDPIIESLRHSQAENGRSVEVTYWLASGLYLSGKYDEARQVLAEALQDHPQDPRLAILTAMIAWEDGEIDSAERLLREVLRDHPDNAVAQFNLGYLLAEIGNPQEARLILRTLCASDTDAPICERARLILRRLN